MAIFVASRRLVSSGATATTLRSVCLRFYSTRFREERDGPIQFPSDNLLCVLSKAYVWSHASVIVRGNQDLSCTGHRYIHSSIMEKAEEYVGPEKLSESSMVDEKAGTKVKRKKLKGKRAVVRWLKFFRWKKKKEYQQMTDEEKILYKLNKARKKEERLVEALKKIEPKETSETMHDPEVLTPEEHFYFLKMGLKCKNYVPVGRRGIYQGVILNMHLHWKKHQTLQVIVKTFSPEEVKDIAAELARLSGGIVLDIHEENTVIMYRGKNYSQPPTEIMSPRVTLPRKKALDKSKYRDALRAVRRYIPRLEQEMRLLRAHARNKDANGTSGQAEKADRADPKNLDTKGHFSDSHLELEYSDKLTQVITQNSESLGENDPSTDQILESDTEDLSDIFETESDTETEGGKEPPLYMHQFDKFPALNKEPGNFEEHLRQISSDANRSPSVDKDTEFDEVDQLFLRAASLLKKKR